MTITDEKTPYLAEVIFRALSKEHPADVVADALLIAAASAERGRKKPRSSRASEALASINAHG